MMKHFKKNCHSELSTEYPCIYSGIHTRGRLAKLRMTIIIYLLSASYSFAQQSKIDSLLTVLKTTTEDTNKVNILNKLCKEYSNKTPKKALEYGKRGLDLAKKLGYKKVIAKSLNNIGSVFYYQGDYESALKYFKQSLRIWRELENKKEIAHSLNNIGAAYIYQSSYNKALDYFFKALIIKKDIGDKKEITKTLSNIGLMYQFLGKFDKAIDYYLQTLKINEELENKEGIANMLNNIGLIYLDRSNTKKALEHLQRSLKIQQELGDKEGVAGSLGNIGLIYHDQDDFDKALENHLLALKMFKENAGTSPSIYVRKGIANCLNNIGIVYLSKNDYIQAINYFKQALMIRKELENKEAIAASFINIGLAYNKGGQYIKAIKYLKKGVNIAKETEHNLWLKIGYEGLAFSYEKQNQFKKAYEFHMLYSDIKDSLFNKESSKQIAEMQEKYESEKREKEIELLNKEKVLQSIVLNRQEIIIWSGAGGLLLVIALAFFIYRGYRQKQKANVLLAAQKQVIEVKNKDITDSIRYAEQIQQAILPTDEQIKELLPDSFVLFKPKDIVSGDFYWIAHRTGQGEVLFAACDCTGHGVPGAFMSMIGNALLNETVNEKGITQPNEILNEIRKGIINSLKQKGEIGEQQDGMDAALCNLELHEHSGSGVRLQYAGANNPLFIVRKGELMETKADKQPIGIVDDLKPFTNHTIELQKGDTIYIFSDGFSDQFGGSKNKKYSTKRLKQLFLNIQDKSMSEQKEILNKTLEDWKGEEEQLDDILVIGVRV